MKTFDTEAFTQDLMQTISGLASVPADEIDRSDDLREDLGLDSLKTMELLSRISEQWDVDVEMEDLLGVATVQDVVDFMSRIALEGEQA